MIKRKESKKGKKKVTYSLMSFIGITVVILLVGIYYLATNLKKNTTFTGDSSLFAVREFLDKNEHFFVTSCGDSPEKYCLVSSDGNLKITIPLQGYPGRTGSVRISPDGQFLTYIVYKEGLKIKNLNTGEETLLANTDSYGLWSPDSRYVLYGFGKSDASLDDDAYLYDVVSKKAIKILDDILALDSNSWISDSSGFYLSHANTIYFYNLTNKKINKVGQGTFAQESSDKKYLVITRDDGIYYADLQGNNLKKITDKVDRQVFGLTTVHNLLYKKTVRASAQSVHPRDTFSFYLYNLDTGEEKILFTNVSSTELYSTECQAYFDQTRLVCNDSLSTGVNNYFYDIQSGTKTEIKSKDLLQIVQWH